MSTSKHIDKICLAVCLLTLLLTGLFVNGEALGIEVVTDADAGDGQFTANDLNGNWDRSGATQITLTGDGGSVRGSGAYVNDGDVHILYAGRYVLSGELTNGSVIIEANNTDKIWILLDGVSLHCEDSAAFLVEQAGKVFLTLAAGTENSISSGAEYSQEAVSAKIDGTVYSRDDLTVNGSGSLRVAAAYKHGIVCNDDLVITGGAIEITAAQDGVHANDSARFANMDLTVTAGDDGVTVSNDEETSYLYMESGSIRILSCYEGLEAINVTVAGGTLDIRSTDDGINANGRGSGSGIHISGGDITIINETGRDADGLDSNGSIDISGGNIFISVNGSGGSAAIDYGSENGGICTISGGTVIAAGSGMMAEGFDPSSEQSFIMYAANAAAGTEVTLKNAAGRVLVSEEIPCSFSSLVISTPELRMGETCTLSVGGAEAAIVVDNTSSGGFAAAGMFGGRGGKMDRFFGSQPGTGDTGIKNTPPELPDGDAPLGEMPNGQTPQNDGDGFRSDFSPGGFRGGDMGDMPNIGEMPGGQMPDMNNIPDIPDQTRGQNGMGGGNRGDGRQFTQWDQNQSGPQDVAASGIPTVSPGALLLVGISVLSLLVGIIIAFKVKH